MGEAKTRAERRREAREAAQPQSDQGMFEEFKALLPKRVMRQLRMRHDLVKEQFESFFLFAAAIFEEGMNVFDQDISAVLRHQKGESKPVDPTVEHQPERLVVSANEVDPNAVKVLKTLHDARNANPWARPA